MLLRTVEMAYGVQLPKFYVNIIAIGSTSFKWLLMINYETYLYIFDAKFGLKGAYNVN